MSHKYCVKLTEKSILFFPSRYKDSPKKVINQSIHQSVIGEEDLLSLDQMLGVVGGVWWVWCGGWGVVGVVWDRVTQIDNHVIETN